MWAPGWVRKKPKSFPSCWRGQARGDGQAVPGAVECESIQGSMEEVEYLLRP